MVEVYPVSDRAVQIDCSGASAVQRSALSKALTLDLYKLQWPVFQVIQTDQALSLVFAKPPLGEMSIQALISELISIVAKLNKPLKKPDRTLSHHTLVVNYGGAAGQDLQWLCEQTGLDTQSLIDMHSSAIYTVEFIGFLPGFAYLSGLPKLLELPRRANPRPRVPAGTVAVGSTYCAVYPWESPGGWHLMGHVEQVLFNPEAMDAQGRCFFRAGDTVRFIQDNHA